MKKINEFLQTHKIIVIIISLLIIIGVMTYTIVMAYDKLNSHLPDNKTPNNQEPKPEDDSNLQDPTPEDDNDQFILGFCKEKDNSIEFYDDYDQLVSTYNCKYNMKNCSLSFINNLGPDTFKDEGLIFIREYDDEGTKEYTILYDYVNAKILYENEGELHSVFKDFETNELLYFLTNNNDICTVINKKGINVFNQSFEDISSRIDVINNGSSKYIGLKKNGKWGLFDLSGKKLIDFVYDEFQIYADKDIKYVVAKKDNLYYLIDSTNKKVINEGYDAIIPTKSVIAVIKNKKLQLLDYNGNKLLDKALTTYLDFDFYACCGAPDGIYVYEENNIINITIDKEIENWSQISYEYNLNTKQIQQING